MVGCELAKVNSPESDFSGTRRTGRGCWVRPFSSCASSSDHTVSLDVRRARTVSVTVFSAGTAAPNIPNANLLKMKLQGQFGSRKLRLGTYRGEDQSIRAYNLAYDKGL